MSELLNADPFTSIQEGETSVLNNQLPRKHEATTKTQKRKKPSMEDLAEQETINIKLPILYIKVLKMKAQLDEQTTGDIICAALTKPLSDDMELVKLRYARNNGIKLDV